MNLLITTDVAARGIDIPLIDNVINLDFPPKPELFVHRVGRAARMGRAGTAYSLLTRDELPYLLDLHLYLGRSIKPCPEVPDTAQVLSGEVEGMAPGSDVSVYGCFPQAALIPAMDRLRELQVRSGRDWGGGGGLGCAKGGRGMACQTQGMVETVREAGPGLGSGR